MTAVTIDNNRVTSQQLTEAHSTPQRRESQISVRMYACINTYVLFTYDGRVQSVPGISLDTRISAEGAQTNTERINSVRMASLIGSKVAELSSELDRVDKVRYTLVFSSQNQLRSQPGQ